MLSGISQHGVILPQAKRLCSGFFYPLLSAVGREAHSKAVAGAASRIQENKGKVVNVGKPGKLTDKDKKRIIVERAEGASLSKLADKYHVSKTTISRVCTGDPETQKRVTAKKEQNTIEMLAYMDAQKGRAQKLLSQIIEALSDPEKLARANVRDLATAYGIIADKFIGAAPTGSEDALRRAKEILGGIDGVIK